MCFCSQILTTSFSVATWAVILKSPPWSFSIGWVLRAPATQLWLRDQVVGDVTWGEESLPSDRMNRRPVDLDVAITPNGHFLLRKVDTYRTTDPSVRAGGVRLHDDRLTE